MHALVYLLEKDKPEALAADLLALKGAMRSCPAGGRRANPDEGKLQISWDALHSVASKQSQQSDPASFDKASLGKVFADVGFPLHRVHWGGVKVYVICSPEKFDVLDKATIGVVLRAMLDKVLLGLRNGTADSGVSAEYAESTSKAANPLEGKMPPMPMHAVDICWGGCAPPNPPAPYVGRYLLGIALSKCRWNLGEARPRRDSSRKSGRAELLRLRCHFGSDGRGCSS